MSSLLISFFLGCLALQVKGQTNCGNTQTCSSGCFAETGSCCVLDEQQNTDNTPLGYVLQSLPGTDSAASFPCALVDFPAEATNQGMVNYLVVAAETQGTTLCIRRTGSAVSTCGSGGVHHCISVDLSGNTKVSIDLLCEGVGPSCEAADSSFFLKAVTATFDRDVEDFCDTNGTLPLPSSLFIPTNVPNMPISNPPNVGDGATPLHQSLLLLTLSLSSVLLAVSH